jgi:dolichol-phosphate mannosyltransferase
MGLGTAYIEGFMYALKTGYDYVITMDADLSHNPEYIPLMMTELVRNDVCIGSRYVAGGGIQGWPLNRKLLSYFGNLYARCITGIPIRDFTSGFTGYKKIVLEQIGFEQIKSEGYAFLIELKFRCFNHKLKITELPIIFCDRISGKSKISKHIIWEAMMLCLRLHGKKAEGN